MTSQCPSALRSMALGIFAVLLSSLSAGWLAAETLRFERLAVEDGLPSATVLGILQDRRGFLWFATSDGLARYDGNEFKVFRHDRTDSGSLSNNNVFCVEESSDGLIWVGTDPGGISVYDPSSSRFTRYRNDPGNPDSLAHDSVWSLFEAKDGSIWVGTRGGLSVLDRKTGRFKNYKPDKADPRALADAIVYRIYQDRAGTMWLGTRSGLQRYEPGTDDFTTWSQGPAGSGALSGNQVWTMLEDSRGNFWVGVRGGGLNLMDRATGTFSAFRHDPENPASLSSDRIWFIFEDRSGRLWISTENAGLNRLDPETRSFERYRYSPNDPFSLSHDDIFWMTEDAAGALWIASRYGGVNKLSPSLQRFSLLRSLPGDENSLSFPSVTAVLAERDFIWIGTSGGGLNRLERKSGVMRHFKNDPAVPDSLSSNKITALHRDPSGTLWIGTSGGGLNRMDPKKESFKVYKADPAKPDSIASNFITIIRDAPGGRLWIGTLGLGLDRFDPVSGKKELGFRNRKDDPSSLAEDTIYDLETDAAGLLWVATARGGLDHLDPATGIAQHHRHTETDGPASDTVHALHLDEAASLLWVGSAEGLSRFDLKAKTWRHYDKRQGLANVTVVGVEPGVPGELWVSTRKGLARFLIAEERFMAYDSRDGLQGDMFDIGSSHRGAGGELFFGGSAGLSHFRPEAVTLNAHRPPVVFTDFLVFNQSVAAGTELLPKDIGRLERLTLRHRHAVFSLRFAALDFEAPGKNLYQYRMEGFDREWSPAKASNMATYTNLPPGRYVFQVRAANNDGIWSEEPARLAVVMRPPWWGTWAFRILVVAAGAAGVGLFIRYRVRAVRTMNRLLEVRVTERTRELAEARDLLKDANLDLETKLAAITELERKVREQSIRDPLTGLHNRRYLSEVLPGELARAERGGASIAFLLLDLDHFKAVNDNFGHQAGDRVLAETAAIIARHKRQSDIAVRYGGEEFLVVFPETSRPDALRKAEELRALIESAAIRYEDRELHVTSSIGVAAYPQHGREADALLKAVDEALYKAKEGGRNRVESA